MNCPLCNRDCPSEIMEEHHLQTRRKDRNDTHSLCRECHKTVHSLFSQRDLRDTQLGLDTLEGLQSNESLQRAVKFIQKVPPGTFMKTRESNNKYRRKR